MYSTIISAESHNSILPSKTNWIQSNCFDFLRLMLASLVIISHSLSLFYGNKFEPGLNLNRYYITLGNFAVYAFFAISGFVITHSFVITDNVRLFLEKRIRRIFPALLTCLILTIGVFGPLLDSSPSHYFGTQVGPALEYFGLNSFGFNLKNNIGNILGKQFVHNEINPVLWTIGFELIGYLIIAMLGYFKTLNWKLVLSLLMGFNFMYFISLELTQLHSDLDKYYNFAEMFQHLSYFWAGSLIYFAKTQIKSDFIQTPKFNFIILILCSLGLLFTLKTDSLSIFGPILIAPLIISLAYLLPFGNFKKYFLDLSYGVYIYGWLVQLIILKYFKSILSYPQYLFVVFGFDLALGWLSYKFVESKFGSKNKSNQKIKSKIDLSKKINKSH